MGGLRRTEDAFCHEALFYEGEAGFLDVTLPFIRDAVARDEPILVVVDQGKIDRLRTELSSTGDAGRVQFVDMAEAGRNPATIIPLWHEFVDRHAGEGRRVRGIGEPIWPGRTSQELVECHLHESLLNLAFAGTPAWWLVCPYDTAALDASVVAEAQRTHPVVTAGGLRRCSDDYAGIPVYGLDVPLPEPGGTVRSMSFGSPAPSASSAPLGASSGGSLGQVRAFVRDAAREAGLDTGRTEELLVAVNEVVTNSIRHGGGSGSLRVWAEGDAGRESAAGRSLICEVRDRGRIQDLLAGRVLPGSPQTSGYGLWLVNHICDLVQVRSFGDEGVVRLHVNVR